MIFFDGGRGVGKLLHANIFLNAAPAANNFLCVSLFLEALYFYLHTIYFSVYSLCKRFIPKFSNPIPPPPIKKIMVCPLGQLYLSHYLMSRKNKFVLFVCLAKLASH